MVARKNESKKVSQQGRQNQDNDQADCDIAQKGLVDILHKEWKHWISRSQQGRYQPSADKILIFEAVHKNAFHRP